MEPDIDVTREVIRFPEEVEDDVFAPCSRAYIHLSDIHTRHAGIHHIGVVHIYGESGFSAETLMLRNSSEPQASCREPASNAGRPYQDIDGLLDPLGLLSDAELLGVLMNC